MRGSTQSRVICSPRDNAVMSKRVERFEDIIAWQKARTLTRTIYQLTTAALLANDFALRNQMRRAAISVPRILLKDTSARGRVNFTAFYASRKHRARSCARSSTSRRTSATLPKNTFANCLTQPKRWEE